MYRKFDNCNVQLRSRAVYSLQAHNLREGESARDDEHERRTVMKAVFVSGGNMVTFFMDDVV